MRFLFEIGYKSYVLDADQAQIIWDTIRDAEIHEEKRDGYGSERTVTYHVYDQDELGEPIQMKMLTDRQYNMAKLAGKPERT
jgi:hypothetical protein